MFPVHTPYYHVINRCVRRAFLCGFDSATGKDYEHRRVWVIDRHEELTQIFAIDVCAYAVMHNHTHLVLKLDPDRSKSWDDVEVLNRWERLYGVPDPIRVGIRPDSARFQRQLASKLINVWRQRLADLSWFMKCLNEHIARMANAEDCCTKACLSWFYHQSLPVLV